MTPAQVRAYQETKPRDWNGAPLGVDGNMGERTRWALAIEDLPRYRRVIVRTACMQRGMQVRPQKTREAGVEGKVLLEARAQKLL